MFHLFLFLQISGCIILGVSIYLKVSKDGNKVRLTVLLSDAGDEYENICEDLLHLNLSFS